MYRINCVYSIRVCVCIYISEVRGSSSGLSDPPQPGDRLRFVFVFVSCVSCVPCVRARRSCVGAYRSLFLSLGLPGVSIRVCVVAAPFRLSFADRRMGFKRFLLFFGGASSFYHCKKHGF